jgi:hypothetical protein
MPINPIRQRMAELWDLQHKMIDHLYAQQERKVKETLINIAVENQLLLGCDSASFTYNGQFYGKMEINTGSVTGKINKQLHPSLTQRVCNIIDTPNFDAVAIKTHIGHMFSTILIKAHHIDDLKMLLPSTFLPHIRAVDPDVFNVGMPLNNKEIADIQEQTKSSTAYINELCLTRLLLSN